MCDFSEFELVDIANNKVQDIAQPYYATLLHELAAYYSYVSGLGYRHFTFVRRNADLSGFPFVYGGEHIMCGAIMLRRKK